MRPVAHAALLVALTLLAARSEAQAPTAISREIGGYRIAATPGPGPDTTLTIQDRAGNVRSVTADIGSPRDIRLVDSRLLVDGTSGLCIVDPRDGRVVDEFVHGPAAISPSGRRTAFLPLSPRWRDESSLYLFYDTQRTPDENRMLANLESGPSHGPIEVRRWVSGVPVYPLENVRERTYARTAWVNPPGDASVKTDDFGSHHELHSPLTWLDDATLAFVDLGDVDDHLVLIDFSGATPHAITKAINIAPLVSPTAIKGDETPEFIETFRKKPLVYLQIDGIEALPPDGGGRRVRLTWSHSHWWTQTSLDLAID